MAPKYSKQKLARSKFSIWHPNILQWFAAWEMPEKMLDFHTFKTLTNRILEATDVYVASWSYEIVKTRVKMDSRYLGKYVVVCVASES